jgi:aryl-alcohol dehydrogenase-like predicted oxidoreductase
VTFIKTSTIQDLVLGTAQFGFKYGIANNAGQPDQALATEIISEAWKNGIREFDTAQGYGTSEEVLGKALAELKISKNAKIITKFHPDLNHLDADVLEKSLDQSLRKLVINRLYGIMLHREKMLSLWRKGLAKILSRLVLSGKVLRIGVSVYSPEKAIEALNTEGLDMVQVPTNILDRRFEKAGVFELAREKKKQIYIRSVFLQGLILMNPGEVPDRLSFARHIPGTIESLANLLNMTRRDIALGYIKEAIPNAKVILGVDLPSQVAENCHSWRRSNTASLVSHVKDFFAEVDERILNPALW